MRLGLEVLDFLVLKGLEVLAWVLEVLVRSLQFSFQPSDFIPDSGDNPVCVFALTR